MVLPDYPRYRDLAIRTATGRERAGVRVPVRDSRRDSGQRDVDAMTPIVPAKVEDGAVGWVIAVEAADGRRVVDTR